MPEELKIQRLRDPVHGLIVFRTQDDPVDRLAWQLIDTPEFQRLRRVRQLGVSEFVFPNATHTRFAHCIGVFHIARNLVGIIEREMEKRREQGLETPDEEEMAKKAEVAVIAALLHDLGHGPFSHTFEAVQASRGIRKRHEQWTAEIIRNRNGAIWELLKRHWPDGGFGEAVASLLEAEDPTDIYHAVVSSSFDADRLDYLQRDRLMTGTGAGAIDFDWLMEHVRVHEIEIEAAEQEPSEESPRVPTFCFDRKALPAAEQFLLARYTLHEQVYFHKTTRCVEHMIAKLLRRVAELARRVNTIRQTGLDRNHPLIRFFRAGEPSVEEYLALDDVLVMEAIRSMCAAPDAELSDVACRLRDRKLYKALDLGVFGHDEGVQRRHAREIDRRFRDKIGNSILKDEKAAISIYTQIGGDDERAHKRLHILDAREGPVEITEVSPLIKALSAPKKFTRYYFEDRTDRDTVLRH